MLHDQSQAKVFECKYKIADTNNSEQKTVILKQFQLSREMNGFKKELKILKKIKQLELDHNGGFPEILSAKISQSIGEIVMTNVGKDVFEVFKISQSLDDSKNHEKLSD